MHGSIKTVKIDGGFGFIHVANGIADHFFHRSDLADDLTFDEQLRERRVSFDSHEADKGPRAANIRAAEEATA